MEPEGEGKRPTSYRASELVLQPTICNPITINRFSPISGTGDTKLNASTGYRQPASIKSLQKVRVLLPGFIFAAIASGRKAIMRCAARERSA